MFLTDVAWSQIQGSRETQQDRVAALQWPNNFQLLLLADGMGGAVGGDIAAQLVVDSFKQHFITNNDQPDIRLRLLEALQCANVDLYNKLEDDESLNGMGTTLIAVAYDGEAIRWLSVGDSPLWLIRNGQLTRLNANHSVAGELQEQVAAGTITMEEALASKDRHKLLEAVMGANIDLVDAPTKDTYLKPGDWVVLASDGVETCSTSELETWASTLGKQTKPSDPFVQQTLAAIEKIGKPGQDNASILALFIEQDNRDEPVSVQPQKSEPVTARPKSEDSND